MGLPAFAFDTLEFVKELEVAGISRTHAEAQAHALSKVCLQVFEANIKELATKDNVQGVQTNLRSEIQAVETNLRGEIQVVETNLRGEIADLRKDMDYKFAIVDTKFAAVDARFNAMETHLDARFAVVDARLDKLASQMTVRLGSIVLASCTAMPFILKLFHLL